MATKGNHVAVQEIKAVRSKTPAQKLKAQRNAAEAAIRLANLQRHQKENRSMLWNCWRNILKQ